MASSYLLVGGVKQTKNMESILQDAIYQGILRLHLLLSQVFM